MIDYLSPKKEEINDWLKTETHAHTEKVVKKNMGIPCKDPWWGRSPDDPQI